MPGRRGRCVRSALPPACPRLYSLAIRLTGSPDEGEDLLQEILLQAHRKLGSYQGDAALGTWLYRLQRSLAVVDQAIDESRVALKTQPGSEPAEQSLLDNFKTKIGLLQDTVALINDLRVGNEAGAARIVSGLERRP